MLRISNYLIKQVLKNVEMNCTSNLVKIMGAVHLRSFLLKYKNINIILNGNVEIKVINRENIIIKINIKSKEYKMLGKLIKKVYITFKKARNIVFKIKYFGISFIYNYTIFLLLKNTCESFSVNKVIGINVKSMIKGIKIRFKFIT